MQSADQFADLVVEDSSPDSESTVKDGTGFQYTREELISISKLPASKVRPEFLKAECNNESNGLWSPWKHEKYEPYSSGSYGRPAGNTSLRSCEPDTLKTRLGPQNPGTWIRGCDPKMQDKPVPDPVSQMNGSNKNLNSNSELSAPPGLRVRDVPEKRAPVPRSANPIHCDWRSEKHRPDQRDKAEPAAGRFSNLDYDSRCRGGQRAQSFANNKNPERNSHFNSHQQHRNNYEESQPEWMTEPTSKFEMMNLGGFEDDMRGSPEAPVPGPNETRSPSGSSHTAPEERSITPDFERMMKDMLNFTDDDTVTEIPVRMMPDPETGSKSSKWFGGRSSDLPAQHPTSDQRQEGRRFNPFTVGHQMSYPSEGQSERPNDLMQILQRANISLSQLQGHPNLPAPLPKPVQVRSLDEIEGSQRGESSSNGEDRQAFNKLLDLLSRRGSAQQQPQPQNAFAAHSLPQDVPVRMAGGMRPSSYEIEEMNRQRKMLEAHAEHQSQQQQQELHHKNRPLPSSFAMVPIQVIRNATATDRRGLLPNEADLNTQPRAITGSGQSYAQQRPVRLPVSAFGQDFDMQRQAMLQQEMIQRQRSANFSPVGRPHRPLLSGAASSDLPVGPPLMALGTANRPPLSAQQLHQLQQLQLMNQQLHQLNPSQLQQTRGMSASQIQQFLMRTTPQHS